MEPKPKNRVRAELYADKRKILLFNFSLLALFILALYESTFFVSYPDIVFALMFGGAIYYISITREIWALFLNSPHLKLYENGIEFKNLGFWEWNDFGLLHIDDDLYFKLNCKNREIPKLAKKVLAKQYAYNESGDIATVQYEFPWNITNISVKKFTTLYIVMLLLRKKRIKIKHI